MVRIAPSSKLIRLILLAIGLAVAIMLFSPGKVHADTYYADSDGDGIPNWAENALTNACSSGGAHTYHVMWIDPYDLTPPYGSTSDTTNLRGASYVCPGVSYSNVSGLRYFNITPQHANMSVGATSLSFGSVARGSMTPMRQVPVTINLSGLSNGCYNWGVGFSVEAYHDGAYDSDSGLSISVSFCYQEQPPPDNPSTFTLSASCSVITISNLNDPDNGSDVPIRISIDGVQVYVDNKKGTFTVTFPSSYEDYNSHEVRAWSHSVRHDGSINWSSQTNRGPVNVGPCDSPPTITITPSCTSQNAVIDVNDPDGGTSTIEYRVDGGSYTSVNANSYTLNMSGYDQYDSHKIDARTKGKKPSGNTGTTYFSASVHYSVDGSAAKGCKPRDFTVTPIANLPSLSPHSEAPNEADFSGTMQFSYSPSGGTGINMTTVRLEYFIDRYSGPDTPLGTQDYAPKKYSGSSATEHKNNVSLVGQNLQAGDKVCVKLHINPTSGTVWSDGTIASVNIGASTSSTACETVSNKPYLKVFGSDVMAGGGFGAVCATGSTNIKTYFRQSGSTYIGSSTQLAAFALGSINGFSSANLRTTDPKPHVGLSFGNSGVSVSPPSAGGGYIDNSTCLPDYFSNNQGSSSYNGSGVGQLNVANTDPEVFDAYAASGSQSIGPLSIPNGARKVLYIDGTLSINGNITYAGSGSWNSREEIPALYIVARNIVIDSNVTALDGIYIAQPSSGSGGEISTCEDPGASYATCGNQLSVNGSFIAKKINFLRTYGSLRDSVPQERPGAGAVTCSATVGGAGSTAGLCAGEVFMFSPEAYLAPTPFGTAGGIGTFDSYAGLPPNL